MFNLFLPTRVVGSENCLITNAALLRSLGKRCLILTGGSSAQKSGALADAVSALEQQGIFYRVFDKIGPNPLVSVCHAAGKAARECAAEFLLGIGGGSPLDATKAAAIFTANADLQPRDIFAMRHKNAPLAIALVGTTAGTGSEVTRISVLTQDENGRKRSIAGDELYAKIAFADPRYTASLPYDLTFSTALDALAHVLEGWVKEGMNDVGRIFGVKAISLLWGNLCGLFASKQLPDAEGRRQLYHGSLYAGVVINICGTAFCHPMGYILTEDYDIPHGLACAVFLPALLERTQRLAPKKYEEIAAAFQSGSGETDMEAVKMKLAQMAALPQIRMDESALLFYKEHWEKNPPKNFAASPGGLTPGEAADLLKDLFGLARNRN